MQKRNLGRLRSDGGARPVGAGALLTETAVVKTSGRCYAGRPASLQLISNPLKQRIGRDISTPRRIALLASLSKTGQRPVRRDNSPLSVSDVTDRLSNSNSSACRVLVRSTIAWLAAAGRSAHRACLQAVRGRSHKPGSRTSGPAGTSPSSARIVGCRPCAGSSRPWRRPRSGPALRVPR